LIFVAGCAAMALTKFGNKRKIRSSSPSVMAGLVPAIPIIWHRAILIEIAGTSPAMTP
jgi:hypothetical protein